MIQSGRILTLLPERRLEAAAPGPIMRLPRKRGVPIAAQTQLRGSDKMSPFKARSVNGADRKVDGFLTNHGGYLELCRLNQHNPGTAT